MSDKSTRKELKEPDSFQKLGVEAQSWFETHSRKVALGAAVVLAGGFGIAFGQYLAQREERGDAQALGKALEVVGRPVEATPPPANSPLPPPFKTEVEKDTAVVDTLKGFLANQGDAENAYTARLALAAASFRLGKTDDAAGAYDQAAKAIPDDAHLEAIAYEGRGYTHEAKNELDQAFTAFGEMSKAKGEVLKGMGTYHQGRVRLRQGQKEEAAKLFSEVSTQAANTAAARLAQERLTLLAAEGIKPPPPPAAPAPAPDAGVATP